MTEACVSSLANSLRRTKNRLCVFWDFVLVIGHTPPPEILVNRDTENFFIDALGQARQCQVNRRSKQLKNGGDIYCASASQMFHVPVEKHGQNARLRQKGKIAELALGYGGSVGALKSMGALEMGLPEEELQPLVDAWRASNPRIVQLWWDVDREVKRCLKERCPTGTHGIRFSYQIGFLFITLPSGRRLAYVRPRLGENRFGGESVTYEGVGATKKGSDWRVTGRSLSRTSFRQPPGTSSCTPCRRCGTTPLLPTYTTSLSSSVTTIPPWT